jgi:hypothetical protein
MDCPYCAESIRETAKVCRHCGRELTLLRAEQTKVSRLRQEVSELESGVYREKEVAKLKAKISDLERRVFEAERQSQTIVEKLATKRITRRWEIVLALLLAILVPVLADGAATYLFYSDLATSIKPGSLSELGYKLLQAMLTFLVWFLPLPLGFLIALRWAGRHSKGYVLLGLLTGLMQMSLAIPVLELVDQASDQFTWGVRETNLLVFLIGYFGLPAFMFISGGFLGDVAKLRVFEPDKFMSGWALRLANLISPVSATPSSEPQSTERRRRERLVTLIRGLSAVFKGLSITTIVVYISFVADFVGIVTFVLNLFGIEIP